MQLITSNFPPVNLETDPFYSIFEELIAKSDKIRIAVGYCSAEALAEIEAIVRSNHSRKLTFEIVLGMHKFDGFSRQQYQAATRLNSYLQSEGLGYVNVCTAFPYHGKMYIFSKDGIVISAAVGSSNMTGILDTHGIYETDVLINEEKVLDQLNVLFVNLSCKASRLIDKISDFRITQSSNKVLENIGLVTKMSEAEVEEVKSNCIERSFDIPIKSDTPKSNLNVYFGKGRENTRTGFVRPRHWYEVELIVPKSITTSHGYPEKGVHFKVVTDDGWTFECNVNGDYSKNFRSSGNLQVLGRWLKGRLEEAGCLTVGELVTKDVLDCYGRNSFKFTATKDPHLWFVDFSK